MINLIRAQSNTIVLTLKEKTTLSNPVYLFEFINRQTNESSFFIAQDVSSFDYRFNKFVITETSNPDNLTGEVELINEGSYSYIIREQVSTTNLDRFLSGAVVETGKVTVTSAAEVIPTYTPDTNSIEVYNG